MLAALPAGETAVNSVLGALNLGSLKGIVGNLFSGAGGTTPVFDVSKNPYPNIQFGPTPNGGNVDTGGQFGPLPGGGNIDNSGSGGVVDTSMGP
jgi:hypothetical protein